MCDIKQERRDEERVEAKQAIDRESRGVFMCPNCDNEAVTVVYCGNTPCGFRGCPECMTFDGAEHNYFCSPECIKKVVIRGVEMGLLSCDDVDKAETILREALARFNEIENSPHKVVGADE